MSDLTRFWGRFWVFTTGLILLSMGSAFGQSPADEENTPPVDEESAAASAASNEVPTPKRGLNWESPVGPLSRPFQSLGDQATIMDALKGFKTIEIHVRGKDSKSAEFRAASGLVQAADPTTAIRLGEQEALERGLLRREMTAVVYVARTNEEAVQLGWAAEWKTKSEQGEAVLLLERIEATEEWLGDRPIAFQSLCEEALVDLRRMGRANTARLNAYAAEIDGQLWRVFEQGYRPVLESALETFEGVPTHRKRMAFSSQEEWEAYQCDRGLTQWVEGVAECLEQGGQCPYGPRFSMSNGPVFGVKFPGVYLPEECVAATAWQEGFEEAAHAAISQVASEVDAVWMEEAIDLSLLQDWIAEVEEPCGWTGNVKSEGAWQAADQAWQTALDRWREKEVRAKETGTWNRSTVRFRPADVGTLDSFLRYDSPSNADRERLADAQERVRETFQMLIPSREEPPSVWLLTVFRPVDQVLLFASPVLESEWRMWGTPKDSP